MGIERRRLPPAKPSKQELVARFRGKTRKGTKNKFTGVLKTSVLLAAEAEGRDGKGEGGLTGYLRRIAADFPVEYTRLLAKLLPLDIEAKLLQLKMELENIPAKGGVTSITSFSLTDICSLKTADLKTLVNAFERARPAPLRRLDMPNATTIEEVKETVTEASTEAQTTHDASAI